MNAMKFFFKTYEKAGNPMATDELEGEKKMKSTAGFPEDSSSTDGEVTSPDKPNERNEDRGNDK